MRRLVLIVLVVGLAILAGVTVWALRFQPFTPANSAGYGYPPGSRTENMRPHFGFGLWNDTRVGVTVTDIDPPTPDATGILLARDYEGVGADGNVVPFEPFELEPGSTRWVYVGSTLPMCRAPASDYPQQHRLRVHFKLYGIPRSTWVDMPSTPRSFVEEDGEACIADEPFE